jgi:hypothetical protein
MDFIKDWFFTQSISILHWIILAVSAGALSLIWIALEKIETSKLGTFLRTILCIPAIILGWSFLGGCIASFLRDPKLFELCQPVYEGPLISIVIFKAIPQKGKFVAIPFVLIHFLINIGVVYYGFFENQKSNFTILDAVFALLAIASTLGTYWYLRKKSIEVSEDM